MALLVQSRAKTLIGMSSLDNLLPCVAVITIFLCMVLESSRAVGSLIGIDDSRRFVASRQVVPPLQEGISDAFTSWYLDKTFISVSRSLIFLSIAF